MGRIARLLSFTRTITRGAKVSNVKCHLGGGDNLTCQNFSNCNDDSFPLPDDYVITVPNGRTGLSVIVGYIDPRNDQKATAGEKRIYARDSAGASIVELWLKSDGSAVLSNANGSLTLKTNGDVEASGSIIAPSMIVNGKELAEHDHNISGGSSAPGPTGPNN